MEPFLSGFKFQISNPQSSTRILNMKFNLLNNYPKPHFKNLKWVLLHPPKGEKLQKQPPTHS
jgi:hypothetical protein